MHVTQIIVSPPEDKSPYDLNKDYEKIPNRLHVPTELANSLNPNITIPS
jgi:hypothetical protein